MGLLVAAAVLCILAICEGRTLRDKLMYPWGRHQGDEPAYKDWLVSFNNTESIRFFRNLYSDAYLCPGGRIGFSSIKGFRCGDASPTSRYLRAPDWTNIAVFGVTHNLGTNYSSPWAVYEDYYKYYYRSEDYTAEEFDNKFRVEKLWFRTTKEESLLRKASQDVQRYFAGCHQNFKPKELLIATWSGAHDVDFCETYHFEESMCACITESPAFLLYFFDFSRDPSYLFCNCIHREQLSLRYCVCFVADMTFNRVYNVSDSWCRCMNQNDYDEDFCDCQIHNICSDVDKREIIPVKREIEQETNTYQMVVMTDGRQTYVMFNYLDINWIYTNTFGWVYWKYYQDAVRVYAVVGFEQENGPSYHHPYSASDDLYKLANETNTGMPGRWMYKISDRKIKAPGCVKLPFD